MDNSEPIPTDNTTPTVIHSLEYTNITTQISTILGNNKQAFISIFNDEAGTDYSLDNLGNPVDNLLINSISITESYTDPNTNEIVNANLKIIFNTNGEFINIDGIHTYWYLINGVDFPTRTFTSFS